MLEHEHSLRAALIRYGQFRELSFTQHAGRTVLVLEDPGGDAARSLGRNANGDGAVPAHCHRLSAAVRQLHGPGFITMNLKPAMS